MANQIRIGAPAKSVYLTLSQFPTGCRLGSRRTGAFGPERAKLKFQGTLRLQPVCLHLPNIAQTAGMVVTSPASARVAPTAFRCSALSRSAKSRAIPAPIIARVAMMNASSDCVSWISFTIAKFAVSREKQGKGCLLWPVCPRGTPVTPGRIPDTADDNPEGKSACAIVAAHTGRNGPSPILCARAKSVFCR